MIIPVKRSKTEKICSSQYTDITVNNYLNIEVIYLVPKRHNLEMLLKSHGNPLAVCSISDEFSLKLLQIVPDRPKRHIRVKSPQKPKV